MFVCKHDHTRELRLGHVPYPRIKNNITQNQRAVYKNIKQATIKITTINNTDIETHQFNSRTTIQRRAAATQIYIFTK